MQVTYNGTKFFIERDCFGNYVWSIDGFDGAPDSNDDRWGVEDTAEAAIQAIEDYVHENDPAAV